MASEPWCRGGLEVGGGSQVLELPKGRKSHGERYWQGPVACRYRGFIGHFGHKGLLLRGRKRQPLLRDRLPVLEAKRLVLLAAIATDDSRTPSADDQMRYAGGSGEERVQVGGQVTGMG